MEKRIQKFDPSTRQHSNTLLAPSSALEVTPYYSSQAKNYTSILFYIRMAGSQTKVKYNCYYLTALHYKLLNRLLF